MAKKKMQMMRARTVPQNNGLGYYWQAVKNAATGPVLGRTPGEWLKDTGVAIGTGLAVGVPEALLGAMTEMPPMTFAPRKIREAPYRVMDNLGYNPTITRVAIEDWYSPAQQRANAAVRGADGISDTIQAAWNNPSAVVMQGVEALPLSYGAARSLTAKELQKLGSKVGGWIRPAEGATGKWAAARRAVASKPAVGLATDMTTSTAQNLGQAALNSPDRRLTDGERAKAIGYGALETGLVPALTGKLPRASFESNVLSGNIPAQISSAGPKALGEGVANQMFSPGQPEQAAPVPPEYTDRERWDNRRW